MNVPKLRFKEFTDEWQKKTLKSVSSYFKSGKSIKSNDILKNAPYPVYGGNGLRGYTNTFNFDGNASLIGRQGALCGNVTYVKGKNYMTEHAVIVQSNYDNYNKFLFYILLSMNLNQYSTQSAQPGLSVNNLLELFNYFPNIQEQEKIAKFLTTVDKKITNLENTITSLENQKKGLLQQIFSQKLRFKDKNGNNYPNWEKKKLGDIATLKNGISKSNEAFGHGKKFINLQDIFNKSYIFNGNYSLVDVTEKELSENNLLKGDVLFVRSSVKREGVGLPCVIMENLIDTVYSGFIIRCRFNINENIYLHYKKYCFLEFSFRKALLKKSSSSANTNINQDNLSKLYVKLPCLEEQTKIADFLSAFDRKLENQKAQLEHWKQIKKGLLQQMFV